MKRYFEIKTGYSGQPKSLIELNVNNLTAFKDYYKWTVNGSDVVLPFDRVAVLDEPDPVRVVREPVVVEE